MKHLVNKRESGRSSNLQMGNLKQNNTLMNFYQTGNYPFKVPQNRFRKSVVQAVSALDLSILTFILDQQQNSANLMDRNRLCVKMHSKHEVTKIDDDMKNAGLGLKSPKNRTVSLKDGILQYKPASDVE